MGTQKTSRLGRSRVPVPTPASAPDRRQRQPLRLRISAANPDPPVAAAWTDFLLRMLRKPVPSGFPE